LRVEIGVEGFAAETTGQYQNSGTGEDLCVFLPTFSVEAAAVREDAAV
jgi:hypothetical protein